ncbi:MAG: hypothetical protein KBC67_03415 [Candidatus Pacebacteria bacterium]|nr:hypothetical protein [Candidatus Paceibacterota bacterium]
MKKEPTTTEDASIKEAFMRLQKMLLAILNEKLGPFQIGYIGTQGHQQLFIETARYDLQKAEQALLLVKQSSADLCVTKSTGFIWVRINKYSLKNANRLFCAPTTEALDVSVDNIPENILDGRKELSSFVKMKRHAFIYTKLNYLKDKAMGKFSCSDAEELRRIEKLFKDNDRGQFLLRHSKHNILYVRLDGFTNPAVAAPPLIVGGRLLKPGNRVFSTAAFGNRARPAVSSGSRWSHSYDHS